MLNKYSVFSDEIKEEMVGTQGKVAIWEDGTVNTISDNISDPRITATVAYDCRECESIDEFSVDFIDSLFDLLLEQNQN